jgi:hypothetical protein
VSCSPNGVDAMEFPVDNATEQVEIKFESTESAAVAAVPGGGRHRKAKTSHVAVSLEPNDVVFAGSKQYPSTYPFWQVRGAVASLNYNFVY